ncbi:aminotransferase class V-fold PLP-dependent enzyme [Eilatimonas milleporae]|uniref:Selenocysteine lyase/cysteine desulfurase n=1 Tax=Eilatimonas milleporae TaxID=911205 RepID=A0A3M0C5A3_9PROT|nr:aminotransferase class V-fold PLP-dependent enzyme [Eilatimonas milleporae]RMB04908.1 selenocysteine lyase/cysteine desulfurase [Eilatimonas milleporae]
MSIAENVETEPLSQTHAVSLDIDCLRNETPGVEDHVHLDNAGASLMPWPVVQAQIDHIGLEARLGGYVAEAEREPEKEKLYRRLAGVFGGAKENYAFAASAVDAWNKAFYSVPFSSGDNLVTAFNEYCSNYVAYLHMAERHDIEIRVAPAGVDGRLDAGSVAALVDDRTRLVSLSHVPSSSGQINPVSEVGRMLKGSDVLYLVDACQSVGQLAVHVDEIGCDMMTATGRKFLRGPRGTGFLYAGPRALAKLKPAMLTNQAASWTTAHQYDLRTDARVFEAWERGIAGQLGLAAALGYLRDLGVERATARTQMLAQRLRDGLAAVKGVRPTCPDGASAAIITFQLDGLRPEDIKRSMAGRGFAVQVSSVFHTRLDMEARGIETTVRVSPHYYNSDGDIDAFLTVVEDMTYGHGMPALRTS